MADITVRDANISNKQDFERVYKAMQMAALMSHVKPATRRYLRQELTDGRSNPYLIMNGPTIIGAAITSTPKYDPYLYDFAIYKRHQGKGYGKPALEAVLDQIKQDDKPIQLDVGYDNTRAQHLYEQAGFKKEHEWKSTGNWHMKKDAAMAPEERKLRSLAKPYYVATGKNSWDHINQVLKNSEAMTQQVYGRPLTLEEKAAILFHDSAVRQTGTHKQHGEHGRDLAIPLLLSTGYFNKKQLKDIGQAILEHDTLDNTGGPFTSTTGEVLASGDANPPDLPWLLNKMYSWQIQNNPGTPDDWKQNIYNTATKLYGVDSSFKYPELYNRFHKNRMPEMRKYISGATPEELWDIVTRYRKKHHLGDRQDKMPASTLTKAANTILNKR